MVLKHNTKNRLVRTSPLDFNIEHCNIVNCTCEIDFLMNYFYAWAPCQISRKISRLKNSPTYSFSNWGGSFFVISLTISTPDNQKLSTKSGILNFLKIMSYHFSNFGPFASYSRNSRMDFFDATFHENVSSDFLTLLSQENTFPNENAAQGSHPSYLSTEKRISF